MCIRVISHEAIYFRVSITFNVYACSASDSSKWHVIFYPKKRINSGLKHLIDYDDPCSGFGIGRNVTDRRIPIYRLQLTMSSHRNTICRLIVYIRIPWRSRQCLPRPGGYWSNCSAMIDFSLLDIEQFEPSIGIVVWEVGVLTLDFRLRIL